MLISVCVQAYAIYTRRVDNILIPAYCVVVCIWSTLFVEAWKRKNAEMTFRWSSENLDDAETLRPEFIALKNVEMRRGIHTRRGFVPIDEPNMTPTPYVSGFRRLCIMSCTYVSTLLLTGTVVASVVGIYGFKLVLSASQVGSFWGDHAMTVAALLQTTQITLMSFLWARFSVWLNELEVHVSDTAAEQSLIKKSFVFQFVNSYSCLFYLAFLARAQLNLMNIKHEEELLYDSCPVSSVHGGPDCLHALYLQMQIIMVRKTTGYFDVQQEVA